MWTEPATAGLTIADIIIGLVAVSFWLWMLDGYTGLLTGENDHE